MPELTSSRKRKAPIDDNGEPVTLVKKKIIGPRVTKKIKLDMMTASSATAPQKPIPPNKSSGSSAAKPRVTRQPSVEDVFDERDKPLSLSPRNPQHILELTDGEEEEDDDPPPPAMDVEDDEDDDDEENDVPEEEEEDDEAELGMTSLSVY
jgi:hypothetical protein